jgi:hypothetical protein
LIPTLIALHRSTQRMIVRGPGHAYIVTARHRLRRHDGFRGSEAHLNERTCVDPFG